MIREDNTSLGVQLPLSDTLLIIFYILIYPLFVGLCILFFGFLMNDEINFLTFLNLILVFPFLILGLLFLRSFKRLQSYALEVDYFHFQPSWYEIALHLIRQVFYVVFLGFLLTIILRLFYIEDLEPWDFLAISLLLSLGLQSFFLIRAFRNKKELLSTAQETVSSDIVDYLIENYPKSSLISEYRFADIQLPSLFLSAGVMSYGWKKNVCLISRYFNWKLTNEELIAVILHEIGHIANNHIKKSYLIGGSETFLRAMRIFCVFTGLVIFTFDSTFSWQFIILILLVFISSGFLTIFYQYRTLLAEIHADDFSSRAIGCTLLANTLRKLPSTIPSPIGYDQSSFLGFRVAILRHRANNEGKTRS